MRYSFANGHDDAVRSVDSIIADRLQATSRSHGMRQDVARYMVRLIDGCFGDRSRASRTFLHGSVPLRTYLPDSDLDLCVMVPPHRAAEWSKRVIEKLMPLALAQRQKTRTPPHGAHGDRKEERSFNVNDVRFINAAVPLVTCAVNGLTVDISAGHPNAVRAVALFEQVDRLVGRDHLFKRSVLLIKAFCRKQALMPRANRGGLSTYALNVMIASVFNVGEEEIEHPLQALRLFLREFSRFDWERDYLAIDGTHVIEDPAAPLVGGAGHGRPPRLALQLSPTRRVSSIASNATRVADPSMWPCHIADPLEPSNDLGRSCTMEVFQRVQRVLKKNHELLHAALLTATRPDESKSLIEALLSGVSKAYPPYWADVGGNGRGRGGSRSAKSKSRRRKGRGGRGGNGNSNGAAGGTPLQASAPTFSPAVNLECEWQALSDDAARAASLVDSGGGGSPLRSASPPSRSRQGSSDSPPPSLLGSVAASSLSPPSRSPLPSPASSPPSSPNKLVAGAASFRQRYGWVVQGLLWAGLYLLVLTTTRGGGSARGANGSSAVSSVRDNGGVELQNSRSGDTVAARRALQEQKQKQEEREQSKERRRQQLPRSGGAPPQALAPPVSLICHPIYGEIAAKDYPVYARAMPAAAQVVPVGSMIAFDVRTFLVFLSCICLHREIRGGRWFSLHETKC